MTMNLVTMNLVDKYRKISDIRDPGINPGFTF